MPENATPRAPVWIWVVWALLGVGVVALGTSLTAPPPDGERLTLDMGGTTLTMCRPGTEFMEVGSPLDAPASDDPIEAASAYLGGRLVVVEGVGVGHPLSGYPGVYDRFARLVGGPPWRVDRVFTCAR